MEASESSRLITSRTNYAIRQAWSSAPRRANDTDKYLDALDAISSSLKHVRASKGSKSSKSSNLSRRFDLSRTRDQNRGH